MNGDEGILQINSVRELTSVVVLDESWPDRIQSLGPRRLLIADARLKNWSDWVRERVQVEDLLELPVTEQIKTLSTVQAVYAWLGKVGATRDTVIVALGGGVLTDLVGFAAATYLRGLPWVAVPTSLLAQVDAAIGGKVGVNTHWGKNLIGGFHLPRVVAVDPRFLSTLAPREWRAGVGEVMKSALLQGGWLYEALAHLNLDEEPIENWAPIVRETAKIKTALVNKDLYEDGPRMYLNLGHTVGHALETLMGYGTLSHGEAVGLGTLVALILSERVRGLNPEVRSTVVEWMQRWGLPTQIPAIDFSRLWEQLQRDKKARTQGLTWVLLDQVGQPTLVSNVAREVVQSVIIELS